MEQDLTIMVAPYGIVIGGELVAIGGLTLFGYPWVVKTKTQAFGHFLPVLSSLARIGDPILHTSSAAFLEAQKVVISDCHLQAESQNPSKHGVQSEEINKSIAACLSQAGYEWSPGATRLMRRSVGALTYPESDRLTSWMANSVVPPLKMIPLITMP